MNIHGRVLFVLAASLVVWLGYLHYQANTGFLSHSYPPPRYCPPKDDGSPPYRVEDLSRIDSIMFAKGYILVARDRAGQLWRYVPVFGGSCVQTHPEKIFPGTAFSNATPPITEVNTTHSTTNGSAYVITGQRRIASFLPYEVTDVCGFHGQVCPLDVSKLTDVTDVAVGGMHMLAVRQDGSLWSSGWNDCGQGGVAVHKRGTIYPRIQSIDIVHDVIAVGAGARSSVALKRDGSVWQWGNMSSPMIGLYSGDPPDATLPICDRDGPYELDEKKSSASQHVPVRVAGLPPIKAISSFWAYDLALARDGTVWGWGNNSCGQLGIDTRQWHDGDYYLISPHHIDGLQGITTIAAGQRHALALDENGTVWAWGVNGDQELGQTLPRQPQDQRYGHCVKHSIEPGEENSTATPLRVPGIPRIVAIAAGEDISAAVDTDGHVWMWGQGHPSPTSPTL